MGCCGDKRDKYRYPRPGSESPPDSAGQGSYEEKTVLFLYTGHSSMTVYGPITGKRYRFEQNGSVVQADSRDAPSMRAVPNLKIQYFR